jgi:hypothetical protein
MRLIGVAAFFACAALATPAIAQEARGTLLSINAVHRPVETAAENRHGVARTG